MASDYLTGEDKILARKDDASLAKAVASHDPNAVNTLHEEYSEAIMRYVYHVAPSIIESDMQDVVQDTFIAVLHSIKDYRAESSLSTWILRIAYFKAVDLLRKHKSLSRQEFSFSEYANPDNSNDEIDFADPSPSVEDTITSGEDIALIRRLLGKLPEEQRTVLSLRYVMNMKVEDVAKTMNISRRMVELHITRARSGMRKLYIAHQEE